MMTKRTWMKSSDCLSVTVLLMAVVAIAGCGGSSSVSYESVRVVDSEATGETRALFYNLRRLAPDHVLFGHQDDLAYGVDWWAEPGRSDVKDVAGAYPAVFGWELGHLENGAEANLDSVNFEQMKNWIREGYEAGSVITISWHMNNPVTGGSAWDRTRAVYAILPGGEKHELFISWLDRFAEFVGDLRSDGWLLSKGHPIPIVFRPYHEHTGSWFWWGGENVTPDEYKQLWRFTVDYLRDEKGLHNLLYAYSTDAVNTPEEYLEHYPGDDYVDVLGIDDYQALRTDSTITDMTRRLAMVVDLAEARDKIAALTETGLEGVPDDDWWTNRLLRAITADPKSQRIAWALVWRNANARTKPGHHFGPYAGHSSSADFVRFRESEIVMLADELPGLYRAGGK